MTQICLIFNTFDNHLPYYLLAFKFIKGKKRHNVTRDCRCLNFFRSTLQTPSTDEDHVIRSKTPDEILYRLCGEIVSKVRNY